MPDGSAQFARCPICGSEADFPSGRVHYGVVRVTRCRSCKSEFLTPHPSPERLAEIYCSDYYRPWGWERPDIMRAMKSRTFLRALSSVTLSAGQRLLDVGCAQGELAEAIQTRGLQVSGIDFNEYAIEMARTRAPLATFYCGELSAEVVGTGWDVIVMFDFIEHVTRPVETLSVAASLLAPGGSLVISTPMAGSLVHRVTARHWPQYREEHLTLFSKEGIQLALDHTGLSPSSIVSTAKYVSPAYLWGQASQYSPRFVQEVAHRSKFVLRFPPTHWLFPLRFGEMTVIARVR